MYRMGIVAFSIIDGSRIVMYSGLQCFSLAVTLCLPDVLSLSLSALYTKPQNHRIAKADVFRLVAKRGTGVMYNERHTCITM